MLRWIREQYQELNLLFNFYLSWFKYYFFSMFLIFINIIYSPAFKKSSSSPKISYSSSVATYQLSRTCVLSSATSFKRNGSPLSVKWSVYTGPFYSSLLSASSPASIQSSTSLKPGARPSTKSTPNYQVRPRKMTAKLSLYLKLIQLKVEIPVSLIPTRWAIYMNCSVTVTQNSTLFVSCFSWFLFKWLLLLLFLFSCN